MTTPTVTIVSPNHGPQAGGTTVTIYGTSFNSPAATAVTFGGVPAASFSILGFGERISAVTPPGNGSVAVAVTNASGTGTKNNAYTYSAASAPTVASCSPNNGSIIGGYPVTVTGTGLTGATSVTFGGNAATGISVTDDDQLTCTVPAAATAGAVDVVVTTPAGSGTGHGVFTYTNTPPPPPTIGQSAYIIERLDNRIWPTIENCWCVDCAFTNPQPAPDANLVASSAFGAGILIGVTNLVGGENYSAATTAAVVDNNGLGPGIGGIPVLTIVGGVITAITFSSGGSGYVAPALVINDPENLGSGASATIIMDNSMAFTASASVFASTDIGSFIRAGYGIAVVTSFTSATQVGANMLSPIVAIQPNNAVAPTQPMTIPSGNWTLTEPFSSVYVPQLAGFEVTGLADGQIIPPSVVPASGFLALPGPASAVIVGLPFQAQLQTTYLDAGEPTVQGQRKKIAEATARIEQSAAFQIGSNQPDGSVQSPQELFTLWQNMVDAPTHAVAAYNAPFTPLFTGDVRIPVLGGFDTKGQIAFQQLNPLPLQVLDVVPEVLGGDEPNQKFPRQASKGRGGGGQQQ